MSQPLASFQISSSFQDLFSTVFHSIPKILVFLFVLIIGWFVAIGSVVVLALGVMTALNQLGVAGAVTTPVLYTVLLTCGAIVGIGVGGGLVKPMQARWERMLTAAERETSSQIAAYQQGHADAMHAANGHGQQEQQPAGSSEPAGPRCLQRSGFARGPGYPQAPVFSTSPAYHRSFSADLGQSQETDVQDDPEHYPGGQYM